MKSAEFCCTRNFPCPPRHIGKAVLDPAANELGKPTIAVNQKIMSFGNTVGERMHSLQRSKKAPAGVNKPH
jgi:hypothetical protein